MNDTLKLFPKLRLFAAISAKLRLVLRVSVLSCDAEAESAPTHSELKSSGLSSSLLDDETCLVETIMYGQLLFHMPTLCLISTIELSQELAALFRC